MSNIVLENGIAALNFARKWTLELLSDIPQDKLTHQPCAAGNHAIWIAGHIAYADDLFASKIGNKPARCSDSWVKLFGMGSIPQADAGAYPSLSEVTNALADNREGLLAWFSSMSAEELAKPLPDDFKTFAATLGQLMISIACHESLHAGQLTVVRKSLGLAPKFK
ncbi:MAG: DinB family protein [Planctomycetes bacterium]|nr:DinB family protein [Planctomycetota bacterium]